MPAPARSQSAPVPTVVTRRPQVVGTPVTLTPLSFERFRFRSHSAYVCFLATFPLLFAAFLGGALSKRDWVGVLGFAVSALVALVGVVQGVRALKLIRALDEPLGPAVTLSIFPVLGGAAMTLLGALLSWASTIEFARGRQLRRRGKVLLPPVAAGTSWTDSSPTRVEAAAGAAAQWRENGRTEHASVAAFAHLTLDLMALGAPERLVRAAQEDALDEVRHTEMCFSLARAMDGEERSPGAFAEARQRPSRPPLRSLALAHLAVDSLIDGAVHEGVSAAVLAQLSKRAEAKEVRSLLKEIAADEGRHAAHGWDVVEWCLVEGGAPVAHALRGALKAIPEHMGGERAPEAEAGEWERYGIHGTALEQREYGRLRARLVERVLALTTLN